jgi:hypothetical protein
VRRHLATSLVRGLALAALLTAVPSTGSAQPFSREDLPPGLRPWVPWVLDQVPTLGCATVEGQAVCVWPGQLRLDLGPDGGTFGLDSRPTARSTCAFGTVEHWPQDVRSTARPGLRHDGTPRLGSRRPPPPGRPFSCSLPESAACPRRSASST